MEQLEGLEHQSPLLTFPDLGGAEYLMGLWQEAGSVCNNGMGITELTWTEISKWLEETEIDLSVWEKLTIKRMSAAYERTPCTVFRSG